MTPVLLAICVAILIIGARRWSWLFGAYVVIRVLPWVGGKLLGHDVAPFEDLAIEAAITLTVPYFVGCLLFGSSKAPERT